MQRVINNLAYSKAPLMVVLRIILVSLVVLMGVARLRIILLLLGSPATYQERDILQEYLMAKALISGLNPYIPLDKLAQMFLGNFPFLTHPSPYPPFIAVLSVPLTMLNLNQLVVGWFIFELICLMAISGMITVLWVERVDWVRMVFIFFLLLTWYSVMVDLLYGQLTLLVTTLLFAALLATKRDRKILAGILIGVSIAIKMFTWPLLLYFGIKKDWRTFFSGCLTVFGLNLVALATLGIGPITDYYLHVMMQVSAIYHSFLKNYSLWSIGYRLFEGTKSIGTDKISAPPLVNFPKIAPFISAGLAIAFLIIGLIWAIRSKDSDIAYSIMICVLVVVSPISWDHYYVLLIISVVVLLLNLARHSFPTWPTIISLIIVFLLFFVNDQIAKVIFFLNGGIELLQAKGNQITFATGLLEIVPIIEVVILTLLLWQRGVTNSQSGRIDPATQPTES
jgi:Glycosyltransferase family 87